MSPVAIAALGLLACGAAWGAVLLVMAAVAALEAPATHHCRPGCPCRGSIEGRLPR